MIPGGVEEERTSATDLWSQQVDAVALAELLAKFGWGGGALVTTDDTRKRRRGGDGGKK